MTISSPIRWLHLSDFHVGKDVTKPLITEAELEQFINSKPELNTEEKKKLVKDFYKTHKIWQENSDIYKKLNEEYENSLEAKLWSNKNPVAHIVIGKRRFGWESPEAGHQEGDRKALTAADIRARLSDSKQAETQDIVDGG